MKLKCNHIAVILLFFLVIIQLYEFERMNKWTQDNDIENLIQESMNLEDFGDTRTIDHPRCALLFFGLVVEFKSLVYPSIQRHILDQNPHCDVFLHTYNISTLPFNAKNGGTREGVLLDVSQATKLTSEEGHAQFESMDSFFQRRQRALNRTRANFHNGTWGDCCISHDNMIKQWHSIKAVWDLMEAHAHKEQTKMSGGTTSSSTTPTPQEEPYYKNVGFFRLDVYYLTPIDISNSTAVIPDFANYPKNDRLFYGNYAFAEIWANRFRFIPTFEKKYMRKQSRLNGLHSETIVHYLLEHHEIPYEESPDICFLRVRSGPSRVKLDDCRESSSGKFDNWDKIQKLAPELDDSLAEYDDILEMPAWDY